jgi:tRNA 2-selenouridine synthase
MSEWNDSYLRQLFLSENPLIDVRAPIEFFEGSIPHSTNLPLMNDEERRLVGLCYKMHGQEAAIKLGHELINGQVKRERIEQWIEAINLKPQTQVFCFRGGLRSQIACEWIREAGIDRHPIPGGYKRMRRFFLSQLEDAPLPPLYRLGGLTGSGKTSLLQKIPSRILFFPSYLG